jgi:hypothetical protein
MAPPSDNILTKQLVSTTSELEAINRDYLTEKSAFMLHSLASSGYFATARVLNEFDSSALDWSDAAVSEGDIARLRAKGCPKGKEHLFFIHPQVLGLVTGAVEYYRNLIVLSKKAAGRFIPGLFGSRNQVADEQRIAEARFLNSALAALLQDDVFQFTQVRELPLLSIGATLDGRWRDVSGDLQVLRVVSLLVENLAEDMTMLEVRGLGTTKPDGAAELISRARESVNCAATIELKNGYRIDFPSNPDILIYDGKRRIVGGGEIKGATDPANVWERWPLVVKTIGEFRGEHPEGTTIFFGLCITESLALGLDRSGRQTRRGIKQLLSDGVLDYAFNFYRVRNDAAETKRLREALRHACSLS